MYVIEINGFASHAYYLLHATSYFIMNRFIRYLDYLRPQFIFSVSGVFLLLDRWLKGQARGVWNAPRLINKFLGWEPFFNRGVAFSLPVSTRVIIGLTVPVIILIVYDLFIKTHEKRSGTGYGLRVTGLAFILVGAISNLIDRIMWRGTIDYFLVLTGVINLADVLIVGGVLLYLLAKSGQRGIKN